MHQPATRIPLQLNHTETPTRLVNEHRERSSGSKRITDLWSPCSDPIGRLVQCFRNIFAPGILLVSKENEGVHVDWKLLKQTREIHGLKERRGLNIEGRPREIRLDRNDLRIRGFHARIPSVSVLSKSFCSRNPFGFEKITTDPHILDHVNIDSPYDRYTKLKICMRTDFR